MSNSHATEAVEVAPGRSRVWSRHASRLHTLVLALVVGSVAFFVRDALDARLVVPEQADWVASDPDGLYHARRVARVLDEGLPVAERDLYLNFPHGAKIPWPPYYTLILAGVAAPRATGGDTLARSEIERAVATAPALFASLTAALLALFAGVLVGRAGAWGVGLYLALGFASISYSRVGNGDHHAWVTLLQVCVLGLFSTALARGALERRGPALRYGVGAGAIAGLMLGSWVAALIGVVIVELCLAWLLVRQARGDVPALGWFGAAFHLSAALVLAPAVVSSPWKVDEPWMVINLSYYHLAHLLLGALPFLPLCRRPPSRRYPWLVAGVGLVAGALLLALDLGPAAGIKEGFAWASRSDTFMATVSESRPLLGSGSLPPREVFELLGFASALFPLAWLVAGWRALRREPAWLPWFVAAGVFGLQALTQARFAEALLAPLAVCLMGLGAFVLKQSRLRVLVLALMPLVAIASHWTSVQSTWRVATAEGRIARGPQQRRKRAVRRMHEWLRVNSPATKDYATLAVWSQGHALEWVADSPSVATNFGSYVGQASFDAPAHFFLTKDAKRAEELLAERDVRYVLLTTQFVNALPSMLRVLPEAERATIISGDARSGSLAPGFYATMAGALSFAGRPRSGARGAAGPSLPFLRLVHAAEVRETRPKLSAHAGGPSGWIFERVPGALVEAHGAPGETLEVTLVVDFPRAKYSLTYQRAARADASGIARVRVPYATSPEERSDARPRAARWQFGATSGVLEITPQQVRAGDSVRIE